MRASGATQGAHIIISGGALLDEPVASFGHFCVSAQADIARTISASESGKMGRLEASF